MSLNNLYTDRLILIPVTLEVAASLLEGSSKEIEKLGINPDQFWPNQDTKDILPSVHSWLERDKLPSGFELWMIVKKDDMHVIGDIGFYGKPDEKGEVTVGYGLVEHECGKGFGTETLFAIMNWLAAQDNVKKVKADCLISNKPSAHILEKAHFVEIGRDAEFIYWEHMFD